MMPQALLSHNKANMRRTLGKSGNRLFKQDGNRKKFTVIILSVSDLMDNLEISVHHKDTVKSSGWK